LLDSFKTVTFCYIFWAKWANAHFGPLIRKYHILTVIKFVMFIALLKKTLYEVQPQYISSILQIEYLSKLTWAKILNHTT